MRILRVFLFAIAFSSAYAQEKKAEIELKSHTKLNRPIFQPDQNLFLITNRSAIKAETIIHCFSPNGDQLWTKNIPILPPVTTQKTYVVATPDGNSFLVIQQQHKNYNNGPHQVVMFNRNGDEKTFKIEGKKEFGKSLLKAFCDNYYLYYLATENGEEKHKDRKSGEKLILNRFSLNDFSYQRFILDLPSIAEGKNTTFWSLIGQKGEEKFLASKYIDNNAGKNKFTIVTINHEGTALNTTNIETALTDGKFPRPSYSIFENFWEQEFVQLDYTKVPASTYSLGSLAVSEGAFGHILYSDLHDCFYIYGLSGSEPYKNRGEYDGFYIDKFDRSGKLIWKLQQLANQQLLDEKFFRSKGDAGSRTFFITPLPNNNGLKADINFNNIEFRYFISADGKTLSNSRREGSDIIAGVIISNENLKSSDYISKTQSSTEYVTAYQQSKSELVVKHDYRKQKIEVILFK